MRQRSLVWALSLICFLVPGTLWAQWSALGPEGGGAHLLAGARTGLLVSGTRNALLFYSRDRAGQWQPIPFPGALSANLNTLISGQCSPVEFFFGTSDAQGLHNGLYRLEPGEEDWTIRPLLRGENVMSIAVSPVDCRVIAAGTVEGILLSNDAGITWQRIAPAGDLDRQPIVSLAFAPDSTSILYAGTPRLPWKTVDGGKTWNPIHVGILDDSDIFSLVADQGRTLIGACSGIYRSTDDGRTWKKVLGIPGVSRRTYVVRLDPSDREVLYAGTSNGLWKSTNGGESWVQKSTVPARSIALDPRDSKTLVVASDVGMWKSTDGGDTLVPANSGFVNRRVGAFLDMGSALLASAVYEVGDGTLLTSRDAGRTWTAREAEGVFGEHIFYLTRNAKTIFAAGLETVFRSTDEGKTWTKLAAPKGRPVGLVAVSSSSMVLLATQTALYSTSDAGLNWRPVPLPAAVDRVDTVRTSISGTLWGVLANGQVFLTADRGATWKELSVPAASGPVYDFALRWDDEYVLGTLHGLLLTANSGQEWTAPSQGMTPGTVTSVLWHPLRRNIVFAIQNGMTWQSQDGGHRWERFRTSPTGIESVLRLHWSANYERVYAVDFVRGIFVHSVTGPMIATIAQEGK